VSSGQANDRFEQMIDASGMRESSWMVRACRGRPAANGGSRRHGPGGCALARLPVADHVRVSPGDVVVTRHVWSP
jgi:hypothetical protein